MALIKCPDCAHEVSDQAAACPHCAMPMTKEPVWGSEVQTIEKTSKKLKGWQLGCYGVFVVAIITMFVGGACESTATVVVGLVLFFASAVGIGIVKMKIYWEHQ